MTKRMLVSALWCVCAGFAQPDNSISLISISPSPDTELRPRHKVRFKVKLHYVLVSPSRTLLALWAVRFPESAGGCTPPDTLVEGRIDKEIARGEKDITLEFLHDENLDDAGRVPGGPGYVAVRANMHSTQGGQAQDDLPVQTLACYVLR